ncbi:MarR family transcriptional regulator [Saxibacter everestensis]|uniref:MarR family transcriptional regulator n=1 Tax=Saxibacter everestensis TaxID=2909229 RepID=A0ABY8QX37_9MICO|nr:MarR family transcriptional regulator [Brevibacteriaceae bacterium ZFBP1038]
MSRPTDVVEQWRGLQGSYLSTAAALDHVLGENFELGLSEFEILDLIAENNADECRMRALVDLTPMTQSALSRIVDRLQKAGLVERKECDLDRRSMFVSLTAQGTSLHARAREVYRSTLAAELG